VASEAVWKVAYTAIRAVKAESNPSAMIQSYVQRQTVFFDFKDVLRNITKRPLDSWSRRKTLLYDQVCLVTENTQETIG